MDYFSQLKSGLTQILAVLIIAFIFWCLKRLFSKSNKEEFKDFLQLKFNKIQLDYTFLLICFLVGLYAVLSTYAQFTYSLEMRSLLESKNSPYGKALMNGFTFNAFLSGVIYAFINSSGAEEVLFRGLIAPRLINKFGLISGNILQALVFWLMHLLIFKLITGVWFSKLQIFAFVTSFVMGLLLCYVNYRKGHVSILPSWILHGLANLCTFLTLALIID